MREDLRTTILFLLLQIGLKLHGTRLKGRRINVEVTCGGGGKGQGRKEKIKERNEKLQQKKKHKKQKISLQTYFFGLVGGAAYTWVHYCACVNRIGTRWPPAMVFWSRIHCTSKLGERSALFRLNCTSHVLAYYMES